MLFDHIPPVWLLFVVTLVAYVMHNKYGHGIVKIPGPFLAAYTDLWRFLLVSGDRPELSHIRLHQKFGPLVRLGPNSVSVADPEAIKLIYGLATGYIKVRKVSALTGVVTEHVPLVRLLSCAAAGWV